MPDVQDLTVLWTDVERVTAEMEQAVQAVSAVRTAGVGWSEGGWGWLCPLQRKHLHHQAVIGG